MIVLLEYIISNILNKKIFKTLNIKYLITIVFLRSLSWSNIVISCSEWLSLTIVLLKLSLSPFHFPIFTFQLSLSHFHFHTVTHHCIFQVSDHKYTCDFSNFHFNFQTFTFKLSLSHFHFHTVSDSVTHHCISQVSDHKYTCDFSKKHVSSFYLWFSCELLSVLAKLSCSVNYKMFVRLSWQQPLWILL